MSVKIYDQLVGHTMTSVSASGDEMIFTREDGKQFRFYHERDCCESVSIYDVCGPLDALVGSRHC